MSVYGIDINKSFIDYARSQAEALQLADRATFQMMDATLMIEFPQGYFDLVTMRLGSSFLRTWDWPKVLSEMARVTRSGGTIRVVDAELAPRTNSPALRTIVNLMVEAFCQSGHYFDPVPQSITDRLSELLHQHTASETPQTKETIIENRPGTPQWSLYREDVEHLVHTIKPFLQKWGHAPKDFDQIARQALEEIQKPDFFADITVKTVWATKKPETRRMTYDDR